MTDKKIVLASASPRRVEILKAHGIEPLVIPADIEEDLPPVGGMKEIVSFLAFKKAKAVEEAERGRIEDGSLIIAADTIVYKDGWVMGKPADREEGFRMLSALSGTHHYVVTGVAAVEAGKMKARVFAEVTAVYFKSYGKEELEAYLDTDEPYDKAGGYAIQGWFSRYTDRIEGDYDNVVGLPWARLEAEISKMTDDRGDGRGQKCTG